MHQLCIRLIALIASILTSPLIFVLALISAILDPREFPFFTQTRLGKNGRQFPIIKIRTFYCRRYDRSFWQAFLRRHKLDELPQLWNIVLGHMTFIGPRPKTEDDRRRRDYLRPDWDRRLSKLPGLTGPAQILIAERFWQNSKLTWEEALDADIQFVSCNGSVAEDSRVIAATLKVVIYGVGDGQN